MSWIFLVDWLFDVNGNFIAILQLYRDMTKFKKSIKNILGIVPSLSKQ